MTNGGIMSNTSNEIAQIIATLERQFVTDLALAGQSRLSKAYEDIITMRKALAILEHNGKDVPSMKQQKLPGTVTGVNNLTETPEVTMADAVRGAIEQLNGAQFDLNDVWKIVQAKHSEFPMKAKRSMSATLANFARSGEIKRFRSGANGAPTIFIQERD
jgi:hypothetical protein